MIDTSPSSHTHSDFLRPPPGAPTAAITAADVAALARSVPDVPRGPVFLHHGTLDELLEALGLAGVELVKVDPGPDGRTRYAPATLDGRDDAGFPAGLGVEVVELAPGVLAIGGRRDLADLFAGRWSAGRVDRDVRVLKSTS